METWLLDALKAEGLRTGEVAGWRSAGRPGDFAPVGIVCHHTAGVGPGDLLTVTRGRQDLPGPLANLYIAKDGTVTVVAAGRCNHAGSGSSLVLNRTRNNRPPEGDAAALGLQDDTTGNGWYFGIEVSNLGDDRDPYPPEQLAALVKACAALCRHKGWTSARVIAHREWTRRKIDPSYRGDVRGMVARRLSGGEELSMADAQEILDALTALRRDLTVRGTTGLEQTVEADASRGRQVLKDLARVEGKVDALARLELTDEQLDRLSGLVATRLLVAGYPHLKITAEVEPAGEG